MSNTLQEPQQTNEEQRDTVPVHIVQRHEVLTITVIYTTDVQDFTYADGTEEQIGHARAELRVSLDRDIYVDNYSHNQQESLPLTCARGGETLQRSQSY